MRAGPFVHREIAADAVAGAVVEIEPGLPQRRARKGSSCAPLVPSGNTARAIAIWPLSTRVKRSRISSVGVADATVRVMSVVPSSYCAPESIRNISSGAIAALVLRVTR